MKKLLTFSLGLLALSMPMLNANAVENSTKEQAKKNEDAPFATLRVFEGKEMLYGNTVSIEKRQNLCVIVGNVQIDEENVFAQYFQAPAKTSVNISEPGITVTPDPDQGNEPKNFLITWKLKKSDLPTGRAVFCWQFEKTDPVGAYKLDVQFNKIVFNNLKFNLVK